jgi:osmotically-inducible protein OsmY
MRNKYIKIVTPALLIGYSTLASATPMHGASDDALGSSIENAIYYNPFLGNDDVAVDVKDKTATLKGTVGSNIEKDLAEKIALTVDGIKGVKNELKVDENAPQRERAEFTQKLRDLTTTAAIQGKLIANRHTTDQDIKIETKNDVVTLSGKVKTGDQKDRAEKIALSVANVDDVKNNLVIAEQNTVGDKLENALNSVDKEVSDAWISTKVRALLAFSSDYPGSKVTVVTNSGKVVIDGTVRSAAQKNSIENEIKDVVGVKTVENNLMIRSPKV